MRSLICVLLTALATSAQALTYVPMSDDALLEQAEVVLTGEVLSASESAVGQFGAMDYQVYVAEVYKGMAPATQITVRVPGNARTHHVPGVTRLVSGERAVLFLRTRTDGSYGLTHLNLGAFHEVTEKSAGSTLVRELEGLSRLGANTPWQSAINETPRSAEALRNWLISRHPESGLAPGPLPPRTSSSRVSAKYTLLSGGSGRPARWNAFDGGSDVAFHAHSTPQQGLPGGGIAQLQQAIAAWNNDPNSAIRYIYGGLTNAGGGTSGVDGVNSIVFNDPGNLVDGIFDCLLGGVLAIGGYVTNGGIGNYRGASYDLISEADIVTNDNTGCFFAANNGSNAAEVFAHELGHTLGIGHSCGDDSLILLSDCATASAAAADALMRAYPHADGRGAALREDDRAAAAYVYGQGSSTPDGVGGGGSVVSDSGGGGGGCAMVARRSSLDPTLAVLLFSSFVILIRRRHRAAA
ncbi:MAG: JDVT-CTERM domain-containing protein [Nevskiales bacterium]